MEDRKLNEYERILHELVLNWKLRLVTSALLTMLGLAFLVSTASSYFVDLTILDRTIVGVAVFVVMIPVYLIIADLPKFNEQAMASMLNDLVPELNEQAHLVLQPEEELSEEQLEKRRKVESLLKQDKLYKVLPNRPLKQGFLLMLICLSLTAGSVYFVEYF